MKAILLIVGVCLAGIPFWVMMGMFLQYVYPAISPTAAGGLSVMGYLGTLLIACSVIAGDRPKS